MDGRSTGGSDACINFDDPDNKGIPECLTRFKIGEIYQELKTEVSLADFFVIMAEAIAARTATNWDSEKIFATDTLEYRFLS